MAVAVELLLAVGVLAEGTVFVFAVPPQAEAKMATDPYKSTPCVRFDFMKICDCNYQSTQLYWLFAPASRLICAWRHNAG